LTASINFRHPAEFDIGAYFEPYVRQWLVDTDNKTAQWVQAVRRHSPFHVELPFR
jgi:predicted AlkP superfamily pyrophosphatase or phosphodiesterase